MKGIAPALVVALAIILATACDSLLTRPLQYGAVQVIAQQPNGGAVANVPLSLYDGERPMGYAYTASDGRFLFNNVPPGTFAIRATKPPGYRGCASPASESVYVTSAAFDLAPASRDTTTFTFPPC